MHYTHETNTMSDTSGAAQAAEPSMHAALSDPSIRAANVQHLIREAQVFKDQGNAFVKQGQHKQALMQYHLVGSKRGGGSEDAPGTH